MMAKFIISKNAQRDLNEIGTYTQNNFGLSQANIYREKLNNAFKTIENFPKSGRHVDGLSSNLNRYEVEKHIIFYDITDQTITIIRILHEAVDFLQILK